MLTCAAGMSHSHPTGRMPCAVLAPRVPAALSRTSTLLFFLAAIANFGRSGAAVQALSLGSACAAAWIMSKIMRRVMNPTPKGASAARSQLARIMGVRESQLVLNDYELQLVCKVVSPAQMDTAMADVAGLDELTSKLIEDAEFMRTFPTKNSGSLLSASKGLLLYGPPGTGKTMLAQVRPACYRAPLSRSHV